MNRTFNLLFFIKKNKIKLSQKNYKINAVNILKQQQNIF
mgnify:CR=1 FL=1